MTTERTLTSDPAADTLDALIADARRMQLAGVPRPRVARIIDLTGAPPTEIRIPADAVALAERYDSGL
jgi:hypothetical protein